jgi:hypothetical protein
MNFPGGQVFSKCVRRRRLISFLLNAFAVPLPPDALPMRTGS